MAHKAFRPNWASAPGDTIADLLHERSLSPEEFAHSLGETTDEVSDLLEGRATITLAIARRLKEILGGSVEFWMSRDFQYRQDIAQLQAFDEQWLSDLPLGDMIKFGWLRPAPHPSEEMSACLRFFDVPSVSAWHDMYGDLENTVAFRTSPSFDSRPAAVAAWLRRGEIESAAINCNPWNPGGFERCLSSIRALTREKNPKRFIPKLQSECAAAGVAAVVVRAPNGCRASGATRFLTPTKAFLLLTFRHLSDDQFWFTFFHEAGHLLLHGKERFFLEGADTPDTTEEKEANEVAERILVPPALKQALLALPLDGRRVIRFAMRIGVSPGIVVGQLQHYGKFKRNQLNSLKRWFRWDE